MRRTQGPPKCSLTLLRPDLQSKETPKWTGHRALRLLGALLTVNCALELSKNSSLLAIQFPNRDQPSLWATSFRKQWAELSRNGRRHHSGMMGGFARNRHVLPEI